MAILRAKQVWRAPPRRSERGPRLTRTEEANTVLALRLLHARLGPWWRVARNLGVSVKSVERVVNGARSPTGGWAVRVAGLLCLPVDDVLAGRLPKAGVCPVCGRGAE